MVNNSIYEDLKQKVKELEKESVERKLAEERQKFAIQILELLNRSGEKTYTIHDILLLIKAFTGFEAVGIRLREEEDFPYYETKGFPADFIEAERYLCPRNHNGEIIRDSEGNPVLECMCGNIISGRTDPTIPFFTEGGSFWTNSTTALLASTTEEDRQARTRNRCHGEGYESVALIPLRANDEIIGLLQLNDRRKGIFDLEIINFFEGIGASIGIAFLRERAEEEIKASLREKEVLLREIHHRVKNNMQLMVSLLRLQSAEIRGPQYAHMFKESQNRIKSMSLIHEKLYQSKDLANIPFNGYVKSLVNSLFRSYGISSDTISLNLAVEDISLDLENAIPCGMIITELVSNSLKYAFPVCAEATAGRPWERAGEIRVALRAVKDKELELTVADDGVGFPEALDFRNTDSLGLHLVKILAEDQLKGIIELDKTKGTEFRIRYNRKKYNSRI